MSNDVARCVVLAAITSASMLAVRAHGTNMILNGGFENNTAPSTRLNRTNIQLNALLSNVTAFGTAEEIDLITDDSEGLLYGPPPKEGKWKLAIHSQLISGRTDAFAFSLGAPIVAGKSYSFSFWSILVQTNSPGFGPLEIGISSSANTFGTLLYSVNPLNNQKWTQFSSQFVSPVDGSFLTVRMVTGTVVWAHLDAFSLEEIPAPGTLATVSIAAAMLMRRRR